MIFDPACSEFLFSCYKWKVRRAEETSADVDNVIDKSCDKIATI